MTWPFIMDQKSFLEGADWPSLTRGQKDNISNLRESFLNPDNLIDELDYEVDKPAIRDGIIDICTEGRLVIKRELESSPTMIERIRDEYQKYMRAVPSGIVSVAAAARMYGRDGNYRMTPGNGLAIALALLPSYVLYNNRMMSVQSEDASSDNIIIESRRGNIELDHGNLGCKADIESGLMEKPERSSANYSCATSYGVRQGVIKVRRVLLSDMLISIL